VSTLAERAETARALRASGLGTREIAKRLCVNADTVRRYLRACPVQEHAPGLPAVGDRRLSRDEVADALAFVRDSVAAICCGDLITRLQRDVIDGKDPRPAATAIAVIVDKVVAAQRYLDRVAIPDAIPDDETGRERLRERLLLRAAAENKVRATVELARAIGLRDQQGADLEVILTDATAGPASPGATPDAACDPRVAQE
jgi:hypothetical protein